MPIFENTSRVYDLMRNELAGVWIDRSEKAPYRWMVAKLPQNLIREIRAGAMIDLRTWIVDIDDCRIAAFGFTVYDDMAAPRTFFGACRSDEQARDLLTILKAGAFPLQLQNENFLPLISADCRIDVEAAGPMIEALPTIKSPPADAISQRGRALDVIDSSLEGKSDGRMVATSRLSLSLTNVVTNSVNAFGTLFSVDDKNEGDELERLALNAFEWLCPFGAFKGPLVMDGAEMRELCDVLALSRRPQFEEEGIFVVETKAASAFPEGLNRKTSRRAASIQKQIEKGIGQLKGQINKLKAGPQVWRNDGTDIEIDRPEAVDQGLPPLNLPARAKLAGSGIILVSDMHPDVEWEEIGCQLLEVFVATRYVCIVLDLLELGRLMTYSDGRPAVFEANIYNRWEAMVRAKTAFIRGQAKIG